MRPKRKNNEINCYGNRTKRKTKYRNPYNSRRTNQMPIRTQCRKPNRYYTRKLNKKKVGFVAIVFLFFIILIINAIIPDKTVETSAEKTSNPEVETEIKTEPDPKPEEPKVKNAVTDWRLRLANYENILPEDFEVEVADIDKDGQFQFDTRAIEDLKQMLNDIREDGILNIWVQSAYRSVSRQKELYDNKVKKYLKEGKTQEEAEKLTDEYINKPGSSDHNLGLAVDFNNVDNSFEDLDAFDWLKENAENYGFILRYPKDKVDITKIAYESWHWRYVGQEHAKKMNGLNMCLEEYIEYLQNEE